jgi:fructokinase
VIAVIGEALIDLVVSPDGTVAARPGGGPYNTARTLGRLAQPTIFTGRLSDDTFGQILRKQLTHDHVTLAVPAASRAPTSLAAAQIDAAGLARYRFYLSGTAAADLDYRVLADAIPAAVTAVHAGTLGLVMEPIGTGVERFITSDVAADALVMLDPNCRPDAITDRAAYLARIGRILRRTDLVKVSTEDLGYLSPGLPVPAAARELLTSGPALVIVTDGPRPARAFLHDHEITVAIPEVRVVDTIGAGDAFGGAFLAWWTASGLTKCDLYSAGPVHQALRAAAAVAALTTARAGAEPPWLAEAQAMPGWCDWAGRPGSSSQSNT